MYISIVGPRTSRCRGPEFELVSLFMNRNLAVIIHGGAGRYNPESAPHKLPVLRAALNAAWDLLCAGRPGEFAVVAALREMERSQYFNAGYGGYPNVDGIVLLDVGLMRGSREFTSIINLRRVRYPSSVALELMRPGRSLLTIWTHDLMKQIDEAPPFVKQRYGLVERHEDLVAPYVAELVERKSRAEVVVDEGQDDDDDDDAHGTVGCVVRDAKGRLYSGTSTGGVSLKSNGRVGDTPIVGSGFFADNELCAFSTTGQGESILLSLFPNLIAARMRTELARDPDVFVRSPETLQEILNSEIDEMQRKRPGRSAAITIIPPRGEPAYTYRAEALAVAMRTGKCGMIEKSLVRVCRQNGDDLCLEK